MIPPQFDKLFDAVDALNERFAVGHGIGFAPFAVQRRVHINRRSPQQYVYRATSCS
jgi:hypothetical protein